MKTLEEYEELVNPNTGKRINMKKVLTDIRIALIFIDTNFPFFSSLIKNLKFIYTFQVPTMATDGVRLLINPEFADTLSHKEKGFVLMHEVLHVALDHMQRRGNHDPRKSNIAADYEVNSQLVAGGVLSDSEVKKIGALFDHKYDGMSYEHIYTLNPSGPQAPPEQKGGGRKGGQEGGQGEGQDGDGDGESGDNRDSGSSNGGSGKSKKKSPDYVAGWNKALEDYRNGKIKL